LNTLAYRWDIWNHKSHFFCKWYIL